MEFIKKIALILVIIGALNWLLVGLFEIDLVASLFGSTTAMLSKLIYIIIGYKRCYNLENYILIIKYMLYNNFYG